VQVIQTLARTLVVVDACGTGVVTQVLKKTPVLNAILLRHFTEIDQLLLVAMHHHLHLYEVVIVSPIPVHLTGRNIHQSVLTAGMAIHHSHTHVEVATSHVIVALSSLALSHEAESGDGTASAAAKTIARAQGEIAGRALTSELIISFVPIGLMTKSDG